MAYRDPEEGRARDRERLRRRTAERIARGLCPRCGEAPPAPERKVCEPCAGKRNRAERTRDARLRAAGKPRWNPERARAYERDRSRRHASRPVHAKPKGRRRAAVLERAASAAAGLEALERQRSLLARLGADARDPAPLVMNNDIG